MYFFSGEYMYKQCMLTSVREVLFQKQNWMNFGNKKKNDFVIKTL